MNLYMKLYFCTRAQKYENRTILSPHPHSNPAKTPQKCWCFAVMLLDIDYLHIPQHHDQHPDKATPSRPPSRSQSARSARTAANCSRIATGDEHVAGNHTCYNFKTEGRVKIYVRVDEKKRHTVTQQSFVFFFFFFFSRACPK